MKHAPGLLAFWISAPLLLSHPHGKSALFPSHTCVMGFTAW
jgi:hypothetical protein